MNEALSANEIAAADPNHAERHDRELRDLRRVQAKQIAIAAQQTVVTMTQPLVVGKVVPPPVLLMARKPASPATVSTVPIASLQPSGEPNHTRKMTTRKTSSVTMRGCTTLSEPKASAVACSRNDPSIAANPTYQIGPAQDVAHQLQAATVRIGSRLDAEPLEDRGQRVAQRRTDRERDR